MFSVMFYVITGILLVIGLSSMIASSVYLNKEWPYFFNFG